MAARIDVPDGAAPFLLDRRFRNAASAGRGGDTGAEPGGIEAPGSRLLMVTFL